MNELLTSDIDRLKNEKKEVVSILRIQIAQISDLKDKINKYKSTEEEFVTKLKDMNASLISKVERRNNLIFVLENEKTTVESMLQFKLVQISELEDKGNNIQSSEERSKASR